MERTGFIALLISDKKMRGLLYEEDTSQAHIIFGDADPVVINAS
jgi:hypothetical protein